MCNKIMEETNYDWFNIICNITYIYNIYCDIHIVFDCSHNQSFLRKSCFHGSIHNESNLFSGILGICYICFVMFNILMF